MKPLEFLVGDHSLEPEIPFGAKALCCPESKPRSGDFIAYVSEASGMPIFRRFLQKPDGTILLQAVNISADSYTTSAADFYSRGKAYVILSITREFRKPDIPLTGLNESVPAEDYLTFPEAQALLKVKRTRMYELLRTGKLKASKMGRLWRIPRSSVEDCLSGLS